MPAIWYDSEAMRSFSTTITDEIDVLVSSKRPLPCDTCPRADQCAVEEVECSAFRYWARTGDYKDRTIGKRLGPIASGDTD